MKRIGTGVALAGLLVLAFTGMTTSAKPPPGSGKAKSLSLSSRGLIIKGKLGSYCLPVGERGSVCSDAVFDPTPTRGRLPVRPGGRLAIRTGTAAKLVNVQLARAGSDAAAPAFTSKTLRGRPLGASKQRWVTRLPLDLKGSNLVDVFVRYSFGDASFAARLRTERACRTRS